MIRIFISFVFLVFILAFAACEFEPASGHNNGGEIQEFENAEQLTSDRSDIKPRWSPTGHKVVFERRGFIYYIEMISGGIFIMAEGTNPCWSPNGAYIAFLRDGDLYTLHDIPERPIRRLTIGANASRISGIDWGGQNNILYFTQADSSNPQQLLYCYHMSTGENEYINTPDVGTCIGPIWSPDAKKILFTSKSIGICWLDYETQTLYRVVEYGSIGKASWYWHLDDLYIIYSENGLIVQTNLQGSERETVYGNSFFPGSMHYNSGKRQITFDYSGIWVMDWPPKNYGTN